MRASLVLAPRRVCPRIHADSIRYKPIHGRRRTIRAARSILTEGRQDSIGGHEDEKAGFTPMLLAAVLAAFSAQAQEARSTATPHATLSVDAADLPFGTGYEARQRQAEKTRHGPPRSSRHAIRSRPVTRHRCGTRLGRVTRRRPAIRRRRATATRPRPTGLPCSRGPSGVRASGRTPQRSRRTDRGERTQRGPRH